MCRPGWHPGRWPLWAQHPTDAECWPAWCAPVWLRVGACLHWRREKPRPHVYRLPAGRPWWSSGVERAEENRYVLIEVSSWLNTFFFFRSGASPVLFAVESQHNHVPSYFAPKLFFWWSCSPALIGQFVSDVAWGELDVLLVDTPPGTSDEHLAVLENLKKHSRVDGAILVTTPQVPMSLDKPLQGS